MRQENTGPEEEPEDQVEPDTAGQDCQTDGVLDWLEGQVLPHCSQAVEQEVVD